MGQMCGPDRCPVPGQQDPRKQTRGATGPGEGGGMGNLTPTSQSLPPGRCPQPDPFHMMWFLTFLSQAAPARDQGGSRTGGHSSLRALLHLPLPPPPALQDLISQAQAPPLLPWEGTFQLTHTRSRRWAQPSPRGRTPGRVGLRVWISCRQPPSQSCRKWPPPEQRGRRTMAIELARELAQGRASSCLH